MRILFLNKRTILAAVFIMSAICSVAANATCDFTGTNLKTVDGDTANQVWEDGAPSSQCSSTPNQYEVTFYKIAICKENPSNNDLTSCKYLVNDDSGVTHIITKGIESPMSISDFEIEPGTYPYMVVIVSSKLGIKHSFTTTFSVKGLAGAGTNCWTALPGPSSFTNEIFTSVAHGVETVGETVQLIDCGVALGTPVFSYEIIGKLTGDECTDPWGALGDRDTFPAERATVSLLDHSNTWASSCETAAKIFWVTNMATPYLVRSTSQYNLSIKTTDSVSIDFDNNPENTNIIKTGADPIQLRLTISK